MTGAICLFCGAPSTRLCDGMIARPIGDHRKPQGRPAYPCITMEVMPLATCDAPICDGCRVVIGHVCGKDPDTIDRCPACAKGNEGRLPLLAVDKIPSLRRSLHQQHRRSLIKPVEGNP